MNDHGAREHSQWSASATERNWNCAGALALTDGLPETTNEAADWGTCCHQIAEKCLRESKDAVDFIGQEVKGKQFEFEVDEEMAETAQIYVDYVRETSVYGLLPLWIEQKFSLSALNPPFEAGGTADAVIFHDGAGLLEVVDLKGGRGHVVEVIGNPQLRTYGLGAVLAFPELKVDRVKVTIVQPRAPHKSGRIRSEEFHIADLSDWTAELMAAMQRSATAMQAHMLLSETGQTLVEWEKEFLSAGDHCKFCKAAATCSALERKVYDAAGVWFDDLDNPRLANEPSALSPEALAKTLDAADMIGDWINAVRAYAHAQAEGGVKIPEWVLVDKIGRRKWKGEEADVQFSLELLGVDPFNRKLVSPAQAEKLLGSKRKGEIADLVQRPTTGTNLVRADKTTRPEATPAVNKFFTAIKD